MTTTSIVIVALVPLILWRLYSRYRRLVGRQKSRAWRHVAAMVFFPLVVLLLAAPLLEHPYAMAALAAGLLVGGALARVGLGTTRFEATAEGFFFTPNARIGIALSLIMVARILYRFFELSTFSEAERQAHMQDFTRSPLTLLILGMLAAYYSVYAFGILRWRRSHLPAAAPAPDPPPSPESPP